jgi:hypothetical protein
MTTPLLAPRLAQISTPVFKLSLLEIADSDLAERSSQKRMSLTQFSELWPCHFSFTTGLKFGIGVRVNDTPASSWGGAKRSQIRL